MITSYLNRTIALKSLASTDEYGQPVYTSINIPARFEFQRKIVRNGRGVETVSEARLFTKNVIKPDDVITFSGRTWTVISVSEQYGLSGELSHYEARV